MVDAQPLGFDAKPESEGLRKPRVWQILTVGTEGRATLARLASPRAVKTPLAN